jgi:hypothetical protein
MKITRLGILSFLLAGAFGTWVTLLAIEQAYREPVNYTRIEKGLYLGGFVKEPPPGTKAVLNLCESEDPYRCEAHVWAKIRDAAPAPSLEWLMEQVTFVARERKTGKTTYHCHAGVSRSAMVVTAYLMLKNDWTRDEALAHLREKRPQVRPNPVFMELLTEWEQALKKTSVR